VIKEKAGTQEEKPEEQILSMKKVRCIILPNNKLMLRWNLWVSCLLIYTALAVPIKVSFQESDSTVAEIIFDTCIDSFFLVDIVLMFFQAFERKDGVYELRHKYIAKKYLAIWFWIDLISSVPMQLLELVDAGSDNTEHFKWFRIFRIAKL